MMFKRILGSMGMVAIGYWCAGCSGSVSFFDHDHPRRTTVVHVDEGHVCTENCDHYYHEGKYIVVHKHRHGPGCGHRFDGGRWIVSGSVTID